MRSTVTTADIPLALREELRYSGRARLALVIAGVRDALTVMGLAYGGGGALGAWLEGATDGQDPPGGFAAFRAI